MTLFFYYGSGDLGAQAVRLGPTGFAFTEAAEAGTLAMNRVRVDDPAGTLDLVGHHAFNVRETACSFPWLFRGYFADRTIQRADSLLTAAARIWDSTVYDLNGVLQFEVIRGSAGKRPAETDTERLAWLLSSAFLGPLSTDNAMVFGHGDDLDKQDYRGLTAADVLNDCATASGCNYFVAWDDTLAAPALHYYLPTRAVFTSTLKISNVLADVNMTTVYAPDKDAKLNRDPSRVFSGVYYQYGDKVSAAEYVTSGTVLSNIGHKRETTVSDASVASAAKATAKAGTYLAEAATEDDTVEVTLYKVRPQDVNLIRAGHRMQVKFTHLPGLSSYTYLRVTRRTVQQDGEDQLHYRMNLTLTLPKQGGSANRHKPNKHPDADGPEAGSAITLALRECRNRFDGFDADPIAEIAYDNPTNKSIGSLIFHNLAYTVCNCPIGLGGWSGLAEYESWWEYTTGALADDVVGVRFTVSSVNLSFAYGIYDQPYLYGWRASAPADVEQYVPLGFVDWIGNGAVVDIPRNAINEGGTSYFCIAPGWHAGTNFFYCAQDLVDGTHGPAGAVTSGGEGNSARVRAPTVTATYLIGSGTSGLAPWVAGVGAIDGDNQDFTLQSWDGTGVPQVRLNGLTLGADSYDWDDDAGTVTLRVAPQEGDQVTFRYQQGD